MISAQAIESVAPDQAALAAASKIKRTAWAALGKDEGRQLAWGECSGSGSAPYRISLDMNDLAAKCTCPSRKFPCKHALGLMLVALDAPQALAPTPAPDWVLDWLSRRRPSASAKPPGAEASAARPTVSLERASEPEEPGPADEKAEARAAAQRERVRAKREESVLAGLDELDRWIGDEIDAGLAAFPQRAPQRCRIAAQRLVDAKAPALATRLDALPAELLGLPEDERGRHAIEVLGSLHLLGEAYRRQERLPAPLRSDVRRLVGWTVERQELLDEPSALRVTAPWRVAAVHSEVQPDRLRRVETWLMRGDEGDPGFAVLIDFVPLASGQGGSAYVPGEAFDAELVFYPSTAPLRAVIASRGEARHIEWPNAGLSLAAALDAYETLCASHPWLSGWPFVIEGGRIAGIPGTGLWLMQDSDAVPIAPRQQQDALALTAAELSRVAGLWDGRNFALLAAQTSLGPWHSS